MFCAFTFYMYTVSKRSAGAGRMWIGCGVQHDESKRNAAFFNFESELYSSSAEPRFNYILEGAINVTVQGDIIKKQHIWEFLKIISLQPLWVNYFLLVTPSSIFVSETVKNPWKIANWTRSPHHFHKSSVFFWIN